jgi:hypothetical protein
MPPRPPALLAAARTALSSAAATLASTTTLRSSTSSASSATAAAAATPKNPAAIALYRRALRATRRLPDAGARDYYRRYARESLREFKEESDPGRVAQLLEHGRAAAEFLIKKHLSGGVGGGAGGGGGGSGGGLRPQQRRQ